MPIQYSHPRKGTSLRESVVWAIKRDNLTSGQLTSWKFTLFSFLPSWILIYF